jgi:hypothetical protein
MNFALSLTFLFIFTLASCGKKNAINTKKSQDKEMTSTSLGNISASDFKIVSKRRVELNSTEDNYLEYKENINNHQLVFEPLNGQIVGAEVVCTKGIIKNGAKTYSSAFDIHGEKAIVDIQLEKDDKNETEFNCEIQDHGEVIFSKVITLKKSYIISKSENPQKLGIANSSIGTLLLEKGGEIATFGEDTEIEIDELISDGGDISTFPKIDPPSTPNDSNGLSGGNITIKARSGTGKMTFNLIGLNGGKQTKIPEQIQKIPKFTNDLNGSCKGSRDIRSKYYEEKKCFGKKGLTGFKGEKGFPGYNGGNTGSVHFIQNKKSDLEIKIIYTPGKGSVGGEGGKGGNGSKGGSGSVITLYQKSDHRPDPRPNCGGCGGTEMKILETIEITKKYKFPDGAKGDQGDDGDRGNNGLPGSNELSFVEITENQISIPVKSNFLRLGEI